MTSLSALPPQTYADARAILMSAAEDMAVTKNVILVPSQKAEVAATAIRVLGPTQVCALIKCDRDAATLAAGTINCLLDVCAAIQVIQIMRTAEGCDPLNPDETLAEAHAWIKRGIANDTGDRRFRWPDPFEMVRRHFKARSSGPVTIQFPGGVRAAYLLDRSPEPSSGAPACASEMPEPLLIRCPALSPLKPLSKQAREAVDV